MRRRRFAVAPCPLAKTAPGEAGKRRLAAAKRLGHECHANACAPPAPGSAARPRLAAVDAPLGKRVAPPAPPARRVNGVAVRVADPSPDERPRRASRRAAKQMTNCFGRYRLDRRSPRRSLRQSGGGRRSSVTATGSRTRERAAGSKSAAGDARRGAENRTGESSSRDEPAPRAASAMRAVLHLGARPSMKLC